MWSVEYYTTARGRQPVAEWLDGPELDRDNNADMRNKIERLRESGFDLLIPRMLRKLSGVDPPLYELRGNRYRIATYYDRRRGTFVLLHGFKKERRRERQHIETARRRLRSYLSAQGGASDG